METRLLFCPLTDEEIQRKAEKLAIAREEVNLKAAALKQHSSLVKEEIALLDGDINSLAREIRTKQERRDVEVETRRNEDNLTIEVYRSDSGELIEARPMTADEKQRKLFAIGDAPKNGRKRAAAGDEAG